MDEIQGPLIICKGLKLKTCSLPNFTLNGGEIICLDMPFPKGHIRETELIEILSGKRAIRNYLIKTSISELGSVRFEEYADNYVMFYGDEASHLSSEEETQIRQSANVELRVSLTKLPSTERTLIGLTLAWKRSNVIVLDTVGSKLQVIQEAICKQISLHQAVIMLSYAIVDRVTPECDCLIGTERIQVWDWMAIAQTPILFRQHIKRRLCQIIKSDSARQSPSSWAEQWIDRDDPPIYNRKLWHILNAIAGANLKINGEYIHSNADYQKWLEALLRRG